MKKGWWYLSVFNGQFCVCWIRDEVSFGCRTYLFDTLGLDGVE